MIMYIYFTDVAVQVSVVPERPMREMKKLVNHSEKKLSSSQRSSSCIERWSGEGVGGGKEGGREQITCGRNLRERGGVTASIHSK